MADRTCQRPGCGKPIRSSKRRDARWCSRSCENKARRSAKLLGVAVADYGVAGKLLREEDQSLVELHERATAPREFVTGDEDYVTEPGELDDGLYDDGLGWMPDRGAAEHIRRLRADVQSRLDKALTRFEHTIRRNFQGSYVLAAQRDPRIAAALAPFMREFEILDAAEKDSLKSEAIDHANKPWVRQATLDWARGQQNTIDFGRDLPGGSRRSTARVPQPGRANDELIAGYPDQNNVFGSDSDMYRRSGIAQNLGQRVYAPDSFVY